MPRKKVTYLVEEDLAKAVKSRAAREGKPDYAVIDDALRAHLGFGIWDELWAQATMSAKEAERLASDEVKAVRARQRRSKPRQTRT